MNALSGSNTVPTAGADVLPTAARLRRERWGIAVRSCSCNRYSIEFIAGNENIAQIVFEHKGQQLVIWLSDCPAIFFVVAYCQAMALGNLLEAFVVIGIASACIFDAVNVAIVMNHFVKQRRADIFDRSCKRASPDVYFVAAAHDRDPCVVSHGEVPICSWRGLDSDGRS